MSKKAITISIIFTFIIIIGITLTNIFSFKSNHKWVEVSESQVPAAVLDTLKKQRVNRLSELVTILDTSFNQKVTFNIVNNHFIVGGYDYYEIRYKGNELVAKKEFLTIPFVIYQNKMYAKRGHRFSAEYNDVIEYVYTTLKEED